METKNETYRQQLQRIARAMATAHTADVYGDLEQGSKHELMKLFVDGNLDKRMDKLDKALEFVKEAFGDEFENLLIEYIKAVPLGAYDSGQFDSEKFLVWLLENHRPTPEQRDYIACQRARHAVENMGRNQRLSHIRFQDLSSLAAELAKELETHPGLWIHLNPIRVWTRFETNELTGEDAPAPSEVLFFAVGNDCHTAALQDEGRQLVEELALHQPCTLDTWAALSQHGNREELIEMCHDLAEMGLVAFS